MKTVIQFSIVNMLLCVVQFFFCIQATAQITLDFDMSQRGDVITEDHYGIFYEEINHAGDGGLYAELIRNRSFEDNNSPDFWQTENYATMSIATDDMLNGVQQRALRLNINRAGGVLRNEGWWGVNLVAGRQYTLSFWLRADESYSGVVKAQLRSASGENCGSADIAVNATREWKKYEARLTSNTNDGGGSLALVFDTPGTVVVDVVSLFPPTFMNRPNGMRPDLAQMLKDLNPRFLRFPGGCYVEGFAWGGQTNRFEWKKTVGPIENRPGHRNHNWGYMVSDGFGFHEMLQLCEDLGANPMFVVNIGIGHEWNIDPTAANLEPYIQEALDAIEYANGSTDTFYGKMRAENGHPAPFNLKYLEIGNEQEFMLNRADYLSRYMLFYKAIKTRWPELHLICNSYYFNDTDCPAELKDEHYYDSPDFFINRYNWYDNHPRSATRVYVGEYAVTQNYGYLGNLNAAIGEAVFMQGCENNSEAVTMLSYAPIFTHEESYGWRPDMIRFNSWTSYGTPSYYVQRMFANNVGKENIRWTESGNSPQFDALKGQIGVGTWLTNARFSQINVTTPDTTFLISRSVIDDWSTTNGTWAVKDTVVTQSNADVADARCVFNKLLTTTDVQLTLDATKNGGTEGFLILIDYKDADNYTWVNLGGWGNTRHAIEQCQAGNKRVITDAEGSLSTGKTYKIQVKKSGNNIVCYLDGEKILDGNILDYHSRTIYTSANIDDEVGMLYVKLVNPLGNSQSAHLTFKGGQVIGAEAEVLTSNYGTDENSTWNQLAVSPKVSRVIVGTDGTIDYTLSPFSVNVLRLSVTGVEPDRGDPTLPTPRLSYTFSDGTTADDSGRYPGVLRGKASISQSSDGNYYLMTGEQGESSYMTVPVEAIKEAFSGVDDYSISINTMQLTPNNTNNYCWAYEMSQGTNTYLGLVNRGGAGDWYYEICNGSAQGAHSYTGLRVGEWHNIVFTQHDGEGRIYVDGQLRGSNVFTISPTTILDKITEASIAHSPFAADKIMEHALFDDFQIFDQALTPAQINGLVARASSMTYDQTYEGMADLRDFQNLLLEVKNYYADAADDQLTKAYTMGTRATSSSDKIKLMRYAELRTAVDDYQQSQFDLLQHGQSANLTFLIQNSSFTRGNYAWQGLDYGTVADETAELFSRKVDVWQEIRGLPAGRYTLTANAFYRPGSIAVAQESWQSGQWQVEGGAELYLNEQSAPLANIYSSTTYSLSPYTYPDNLTSAGKAFNTDGQYAANSISIELQEGETLRLGIRKLGYIDADWVAFDHFQFTYDGSADAITVINAESKTVDSQTVYTIDGRPTEGRNRGLYIVNGKKIFVR